MDTVAGSLRPVTAPLAGVSRALLLSESDAEGVAEALAVVPGPATGPDTLAIEPAAFASPPAPEPLGVRLDRRLALPLDRLGPALATVTRPFLAALLRRLTLRDAARYYAAAHAGRTAFAPGGRVPYAGRVFDAREIEAVVDAGLEFFLTAGRHAARFEAAFAERLGVRHALLVNSGSSANLLALTALLAPELGDRRLKPGDEVLTVAAGFPTTLAPILQNGLMPVFVDVGLGDYNALPDRLAAAIGPRTRAVVLPHTLGLPFDLDAVLALVRRHDLWLVEDACDALGARYRGRPVGAFGHLATFSFYPAHHITLGEGGCVATHDDTLATVVRSLRDWGRDCVCQGGQDNTCGRRFTGRFGTLPAGYDHKYVYGRLGYNLKATDLQAAIGCAQLEKLDGFIARRRDNFARLYALLEPFGDRLILPRATPHADPAWFAFALTVRTEAGFDRGDLIRFLEAERIETRPLFGGNLLRHPAFLDIPCRVAGGLANTDLIADRTFFVGVYPGLEDGHLRHIGETVARFLRGARAP